MLYKAGLAIAALVIATPALADEMDFILTNASGKEIKLIEVAPAGSGTWQKNKIDEEVKKAVNIKNTGRSTIHFDQTGSQCKYDIRATFVDDTNAVWANVNVCDDTYITIKYKADGTTPIAVGT